MSRIPLVATVVGALLVGGATMGGTFASWTSQRPLHANGVQSGQLSFTATSPGAVAVDQTAGSTAESTFVLDDTSTGKNNQQRITASVAGAPAGITATIGISCPAATSASVAVDTTPTSANRSLCVRVTVTNQPTTAVSGDVTVTISGTQRPAGWSTPITTIQVPITVTPLVSEPDAPVISCGGFQSNGNYRITWTATSGSSYVVYRSTGTNDDGSYRQQATATNSYTASLANPSTTYWRVKAVNGAGDSGWSNTLVLTRDGNGINSIDCGPVTP